MATDKPQSPCPVCGCRLYKETGPCAGEDARSASAPSRDAVLEEAAEVVRHMGDPDEYNKGGDNLVWDDPGGNCTPLYAAPQVGASSQPQTTSKTVAESPAESAPLLKRPRK